MIGRGAERRRRGPTARVVVLAVVAVALVVGLFAALARGDGGGVPPNVEIDGIALGGSTREAAEAQVRERARALMGERTVIESGERPDFGRELTRRDLAAQPRIGAALDEATAGRGPLGRALTRIGLGGTRSVPLLFTYDEARLGDVVAEVAGELDSPARGAGVEIGPDELTVTSAAAGRVVDRTELVRALERFPRRIEAPLIRQEPPVPDSAAARAKRVAERLLATPPTVILGTVRAPLTAEDVRDALGFAPQPPRLDVTLDPEVLSARLGPAFSDGERAPVDAAFEIVGERVRVTPSRPGRAVDMRRLAATLVARAGRPLTGARFTSVAPERTTAQARELRITERVSSFSTPYTCCPSRVTNIQRGAEILDGTIIPAGARFSLNEALGERTAERGFVAAGQIVNGRLEDAVGGGVSQIATTIYNASFFAGLDIVTHTPHQFYISRYPEGREATVSWGGPELIVRNDWPAAVLLKVAAGSSGISVDMYSTSLGRRIETEVTSRQAGRAPRVIEKRNPDLEPGTRNQLQSTGAAGFTIAYTRRVLVNGRVKRDENYRWRYAAQDAYVEVGPPEKKPEKEDEPAPEPDGDAEGEAPADREGSPPADPPPTVEPPASES